MQRDYKYLIYILIASALFSFYNAFIELPSRNLCSVLMLALLFYPFWRRETPNPNFATYLVYVFTTFWIFQAWYRIEYSLSISYKYYSTTPPQHVDFLTALLGASRYILFALLLLIDEFFVTRRIRKYFYNIDNVDSNNLKSYKKDVSKILKEGNTITLYSKSGIDQAKENAKRLAIKHKNIFFATEDEIDAKPQEYVHIARLHKI